MLRKLSDLKAPASQPTIWAALLIAIYIGVPVFFVLTLVELWWRFA